MKSSSLLNDNYAKINQIAARCMRIIAIVIFATYGYTIAFSGMDQALLTIVFGLSIFVAIIPTIIINIFKFDSSPSVKYIVIICICFICTMMRSIMSSYAFPIALFPILVASLYFNQTLVLFASLLISAGILSADVIATKYNDILIGCHFT